VLFKDETGSSIVEVTIAMVVFIIIMVGGLNYYFLPQATIARQKTKRLVVTAAGDRMEKLVALQYAGVTPDSNETNTPVTVGNITGNRTTTITEVDDAADGLSGADADSDTVDYKLITVAMSWNDGTAKSITFSTIVSIDDSTASGGSSQVPANLTDFPVLLTEATLPTEMLDADGTYPALNGGGDIRFSSDSGGSTRLSCEIVDFTTDNNPANGKGEIWVKVPTVSSSSNTSIWVWYDSSAASQPHPDSTYGSKSVWDSNYKGVWHLNESGNGTADEFADATSNANDGQGVGGGSQLTTVVTVGLPGWQSNRKRVVFYNGAHFFLLYTNIASSPGDGTIYYKSSADNVSWSAQQTLITDQITTIQEFDIYLVNDTKFDLAYTANTGELWGRTCTIAGDPPVITAGDSSSFDPADANEVSIVRGDFADRVYAAWANGATNGLTWSSTVEPGDIAASNSHDGQGGGGSRLVAHTLVPYAGADKVLLVYAKDPGGSNSDGLYYREWTHGTMGAEAEVENWNEAPDFSNMVRISDTDFRIIVRRPGAVMQEWKWDDANFTYQVDLDTETDQTSPSLFYDRVSGDMYAFSIDTGTDDVERHKKPSGGSWGTEVVVDDGEAGAPHTFPITQTYEPPHGSSRTTPRELVWAYGVANGSNRDLIVGNLGGVGPAQVTGKIGNAQDFDGNDTVSVPEDNSLDTPTDLTASYWHKPPTASGVHPRTLDKQGSWDIKYNEAEGFYNPQFSQQNGGGKGGSRQPHQNRGSWHRCVAVYRRHLRLRNHDLVLQWSRRRPL